VTNAVTKPTLPQRFLVCPHCGFQTIVVSTHWGRTSCCSCGAPLTISVSDIPEYFASVVEMDRRRNENVFGRGAGYGALCNGIVLIVFTIFPVAWLAWDLQGSWPLVESMAETLFWWTVAGASFGAMVLSVLSATLASSRAALRGATQGMVTCYALGALLGASYIFLRNVVSGGQMFEIWIIQSEQVTTYSIMAGSVFAALGSLAGSVLAQPQTTIRSAVVPPRSARYRFGISRIFILTAAIAIVIAIPTQILLQLMKVTQLAKYRIMLDVLIVALIVLMLTLVIWAVMRGPTVYSRLAKAFIDWRQIKRGRDELRSIPKAFRVDCPNDS
jgi:hypothetical protein